MKLCLEFPLGIALAASIAMIPPVSAEVPAAPNPPPLTEKVKLNAMIQRAKADLATLDATLQLYKITTGSFPTTEQGLDVLVNTPKTQPVPKKWMQLIPKLPKDPWGNAYRYAAPDKEHPQEITLASDGPDGKSSTADDVVTKINAGKNP